MANLNVFEKTFLDLNKTPDVKETAKENRVMAVAALETQIAIGKSKVIGLERAVRAAEKRVANALANHGKDMGDDEKAGQRYVQEILDAELALELAKANLVDHNTMLSTLTAKLEIIK